MQLYITVHIPPINLFISLGKRISSNKLNRMLHREVIFNDCGLGGTR